MSSSAQSHHTGREASLWRFGSESWLPGPLPRIMGIVNVTPDSFSDGGRYLETAAAVRQGQQLVADGAAVLDIGGESTRPGADPVPEEEELRRVIPVITALASSVKVPLSIDTMKARVAREALQAGASIVNDVSGLLADPLMESVCVASNCGVIVMHMNGTPQTMQLNPHYSDVVAEVRSFFESRLRDLVAAGIASERIMFDPGIGFGKTAEHNLQLLSHVNQLRVGHRPLLIGHSRKRFLKRLLGREVDERSSGTLGVALALAAQGVDLIRVHDVASLRDTFVAWRAVMTGQIDALE
ncbi:MAG: dihydropteroate synthase [Planctomycetaceae bacterium]